MTKNYAVLCERKCFFLLLETKCSNKWSETENKRCLLSYVVNIIESLTRWHDSIKDDCSRNSEAHQPFIAQLKLVVDNFFLSNCLYLKCCCFISEQQNNPTGWLTTSFLHHLQPNLPLDKKIIIILYQKHNNIYLLLAQTPSGRIHLKRSFCSQR